MNKVLAYTILILLGGKSFAQSNLVPNPSFEEYTSCPNDIGQMYRVDNWSSYGGTSDFFNTCAPLWWADVPQNAIGYQQPATGNAYCGFATFATSLMNEREFIGVQLSSPLTVSIKYFISLNVSRGFSIAAAVGAASDKIGALFTMNSYDSINAVPINNFAHLYTNTIITDTTNWTLISGSYIADSAYSYLTIGNFFDDINTNVIDTNISTPDAYYYIDDVCVSIDSAYCANFVGLNDNAHFQKSIKVFPNPSLSGEPINILLGKDASITGAVTIFNSIGQMIQEIKSNNSVSFYAIKNLSKGMYFLCIPLKEEVYTVKFIITN